MRERAGWMEEGCHGKTACFDSVEEGMGRERRGEGGGDGGMDNIGRTDRGGEGGRNRDDVWKIPWDGGGEKMRDDGGRVRKEG